MISKSKERKKERRMLEVITYLYIVVPIFREILLKINRYTDIRNELRLNTRNNKQFKTDTVAFE